MTIEFSDFSFKYASLDKPTLKNINLRIEKGQKVLIVGPSGSGKSTLGQCLNGLIPHAIKGETSGSLSIGNRDTRSFEMHDFTLQLGTVLQDTDSQFVGLSVGEDIAFALENQMVSNLEMYPIVKSTASMVNLEQMLNREPSQLSGGQKQKVSLAGILVDQVDALLFDEPLAALDPVTSKKTIEIIDDLHRTSGKTIIIIEHRLEDVLHREIDRIILMEAGEIVADMSTDDLLCSGLLSKHGIREPLYLSAVKAAGVSPTNFNRPSKVDELVTPQVVSKLNQWYKPVSESQSEVRQDPLLSITNLTYSYDDNDKVVNDVSFHVNKGEFVSILGKNGSGKSTITKLIMGVLNQDKGSITIDGIDLATLSIFERSEQVGVVMQNPNHMISHHMIYDEVAFGLRNKATLSEQQIEEKVDKILDLCGLSKYKHWPIEALSYGQKKRVTIASILILEPKLLILDEPTAGQDYNNYSSMLKFIEQLNKTLGTTVLIISHDLHLVLEYTTRSIVLADGELIADKPMTEVFSDPKLLRVSNLATTSLYELAKISGIEDTQGFMNFFITRERAA
ncbi:ABC transporter ATP-binding protein [Vibrio sonorensis]|uniref:ABC transporter ATP-binding protein n=1 Tax=Vibrio sonorensis TaxID=1004316 RepID=UPI0008DAD5F9|nr:ABC transporter ATP-binding protein [Vibrio sonorensis]